MKKAAYILIAILISAVISMALYKLLPSLNTPGKTSRVIAISKKNQQYPLPDEPWGLKQWGFELAGEKKIPAYDFEVKNIKGNTISLSDYKGKLLILNFWASWCPPCIDEIPSMEQAASALKDWDVEILAISSGEAVDTVSEFINKTGMTLKTAVDPDSVTSELYSISSLPTSFIISKDGYFIARKTGAMDWSDKSLLQLIKNL